MIATVPKKFKQKWMINPNWLKWSEEWKSYRQGSVKKLGQGLTVRQSIFYAALAKSLRQTEVESLRRQNVSMRNLLDQNETGFFSRFTSKKKNESQQNNENFTAMETKIALLTENLTQTEDELARVKSSLLQLGFTNFYFTL